MGMGKPLLKPHGLDHQDLLTAHGPVFGMLRYERPRRDLSGKFRLLYPDLKGDPP